MSNKKWVSESTKKSTASNKEILLALLGVLFVSGLLGFIGFSFAKYISNERHKLINNNPAYTICIITGMHPYKGKSVDLECFINEKKRYYSEPISPEYYRTLKIGQEVAVKYCKDDPSLATIVEP